MQVGDECRLPGLRLFFRVVDLSMRLSVRLKRCRRVLQRTAIGKSPPVAPTAGDYVHLQCDTAVPRRFRQSQRTLRSFESASWVLCQ